MEPVKITLILPFPPKELSPNKRLHWAQVSKVKKSYRETCYWFAKDAIRKTFDKNTKFHIYLTFYPPDKRRRDDDNMESAFKAGRDGVADALNINDHHFTVTRKVSDLTLNKVEMVIEEVNV